MKRKICALMLALGLTAAVTGQAAAAAFTDVPSGAWYAEAVAAVSDGGIMNGTTTTTFSPDGQVTRGMVAAVLWRMAGSPAPKGGSSFADVEAWYFYADAVAWAEENGIAAGRSDGSFGGGDIVTGSSLRFSSTDTANMRERSWLTAYWTYTPMWTASTHGPARAWPMPWGPD